MSAVSGPSFSCVSVSPSQLRRMLEQAMPSDAQLEAFCIDYVPAVHRQYSSGMERTQKLNLLLASTPPEELLEYLRCHAATVPGRELARPAPPIPPTATPQRRAGHIVGFGCAAAGAVGAVVLAVGLHWPRNRSASSESAATGHALSVLANHDSPVAIALPWLTSEPSPALVYAVPSGRPLGQTPWTPELAAPWDPLAKGGVKVCLRSAGFIPVLVRLEPAADPSRSRSIHIRLQREPRAVSQRDLGQETCNVPTPIIE